MSNDGTYRRFRTALVKASNGIVGGHSDIFTSPFVEFLVEFIFTSRVKRRALQCDSGFTTLYASNDEDDEQPCPRPPLLAEPVLMSAE